MQNLILSEELRMQKYKDFSRDQGKLLISRLYALNNIGCLDQGYLSWQSLLNKHYPKPNYSTSWQAFRGSSIWRHGYQEFTSAFDYEEANNIASKCTDKSFDIDTQSVSPLTNFLLKWSSTYLPEDFVLTPWRSQYFSLNKNSARKSVSSGWHYDSEIPDYVIFFMFYLNQVGVINPQLERSGTLVIDANTSQRFSLATDYVSFPIGQRFHDLEHACNTFRFTENCRSHFIDATEGKVFAFMPSRSMHRACVSSPQNRNVLHVAAAVSPLNSVNLNDSSTMSDHIRNHVSTNLAASFDENHFHCVGSPYFDV